MKEKKPYFSEEEYRTLFSSPLHNLLEVSEHEDVDTYQVMQEVNQLLATASLENVDKIFIQYIYGKLFHKILAYMVDFFEISDYTNVGYTGASKDKKNYIYSRSVRWHSLGEDTLPSYYFDENGNKVPYEVRLSGQQREELKQHSISCTAVTSGRFSLLADIVIEIDIDGKRKKLVLNATSHPQQLIHSLTDFVSNK